MAGKSSYKYHMSVICVVCVLACMYVYSLIHYFCERNNDFPTCSYIVLSTNEFHSNGNDSKAERERESCFCNICKPMHWCVYLFGISSLWKCGQRVHLWAHAHAHNLDKIIPSLSRVRFAYFPLRSSSKCRGDFMIGLGVEAGVAQTFRFLRETRGSDFFWYLRDYLMRNY